MCAVPFVDLNRQHAVVQAELTAAFERVTKSGAFILGNEVKAFEAAWAEYCQAQHAIGCANGTDALVLIMLGLGIGPGDEVITVSNTFFATVEAIVSVGATPVLVDVLPENGLMDPALIPTAISSRTKAVLPVHLYGQPVDLDPIIAISKKHNLFVIEDAAQAHGARYKGKPIGALSTAAAFSFYPGKNLGALGDAGAIVTNDAALAARLRSLRDHGRSEKYAHREFAWNMRMDGLQGAFVAAKLPKLNQWNSDRRTVAALYRTELNGIPGLRLLEQSPNVEHAYHLFVVINQKRDQLRDQLKTQGIETGVHYPLGCHQQEAWLTKFGKLSLPVTEELAATCLSLPIFGGMTEEEAKEVIAKVRTALGG